MVTLSGRAAPHCPWESLALSFVPVRSNSIRASSRQIVSTTASAPRPLPQPRDGAEAFPFPMWNLQHSSSVASQHGGQ